MTIQDAQNAYNAASAALNAQANSLNQIYNLCFTLHAKVVEAQNAEQKAQNDFIAARSGMTQLRVNLDNARQALQAAIQADTVNVINQWT